MGQTDARGRGPTSLERLSRDVCRHGGTHARAGRGPRRGNSGHTRIQKNFSFVTGKGTSNVHTPPPSTPRREPKKKIE